MAGIEFNVTSATAPAGFVGTNDTWDDQGDGTWRLRVWILRPFQNEPDVFADTHPCLDAGGPIYDTTAACYVATHPNPLRILVSNDDGYAAAGINAAVQGLQSLPNPNVDITVVAPATNQSGQGGNTTPDPLTATDELTAGGYAVKAVQGHPADAVRYALRTMHVSPDLLVSGINDGQNLGTVIPLSGTVGAARVGARDGIPAVALSQGFGPPPDFASGAAAMLVWVNDFLLGRVGPQVFQSVVNINIPSCTSGSIRGTLFVPPANTFNLGGSDCTSTETTIPDDVAGYVNGFVTVSSIGT